MAATVTVKRIEPRTIAYLHRTGAFDAIPEAMQALFAWIDQNELEPVAAPGGRYFTDPSNTPADHNEWEVFVEIAVPRVRIDPSGDAATTPRIRDLHATEFAVAMHRGPYDQVAQTYAVVGNWIARHDYEHAGPTEELYLTEPDVAPEDLLTEVRIPVVHVGTPHAEPA